MEFVGPESLFLFFFLPAVVMFGADFHTPPSVPLQTGVKFEHLVNPFGVESDVDEKRRLRRGAFRPLDTHADDDLALVLLANQRTSVVFLQRDGSGGGNINKDVMLHRTISNI